METKKVAETINIRINVGNYQHVEISKYAEKEISYESKEEMIEKEDQVTAELLDNIIRNMRRIPGKLGKETDAVEKIEEKISKTLPEFMKGSEEPNLAKKKAIQTEAEEKDNEDKKEAKAKGSKKEVEGLVEEDATKKEEIKVDEDNLFEDDLFD